MRLGCDSNDDPRRLNLVGTNNNNNTGRRGRRHYTVLDRWWIMDQLIHYNLWTTYDELGQIVIPSLRGITWPVLTDHSFQWRAWSCVCFAQGTRRTRRAVRAYERTREYRYAMAAVPASACVRACFFSRPTYMYVCACVRACIARAALPAGWQFAAQPTKKRFLLFDADTKSEVRPND